MLLLLLLELELELALLGRSILQGTATSFSPPEEELLLGEALLGEALEELEAELEELPWLELEFNASTAKSIRPELAFTIQSLMVPNCWPEEPVTCAPVNWLARSSWRPMLP